MKDNHEAEIITNDHRVVANTYIIEASEDFVSTLVPRSMVGSPITFSCHDVFNLVFSTHEYIFFYKVRFAEISLQDDKPVYRFRIIDGTPMKNNRKEERKNVEFQAVVTDLHQIGVVTILDLSDSGMKIESTTPIDSIFLELFYDESNTPKRAKGEIIWHKEDQEKQVHYYGLNLTYR